MRCPQIQLADVTAFLAHTTGQKPVELGFKVRPLSGGLDSAGVLHVTARYRFSGRHPRMVQFVVKRLSGPQKREAAVYRALRGSPMSDLSPHLLWIQEAGGECRLYLESIRPAERWPWQETRSTSEVMRSLARFHLVPLSEADLLAQLRGWDYEAELAERGRRVRRVLEPASRNPDLAFVRRTLPALRKLVAALPRIRLALLRFSALRPAWIHGDVHPGNVMVRRRTAGPDPVFLDWGRSRIGSPLEDVSSWLQTLGYWEPEARRRHDTLLSDYLAARGDGLRASRDLRDAYWLAAASNLLAGAILHQAGIITAPDATALRKGRASHALADYLRILRRANACWCSR